MPWIRNCSILVVSIPFLLCVWFQAAFAAADSDAETADDGYHTHGHHGDGHRHGYGGGQYYRGRYAGVVAF